MRSPRSTARSGSWTTRPEPVSIPTRRSSSAVLARAQFIGYPGDPVQYPVPFATRFGVLHIRPEGARLLPVVVNRETVSAFLDARRLYGWDQGSAKTVIGEPVERPARSAAA